MSSGNPTFEQPASLPMRPRAAVRTGVANRVAPIWSGPQAQNVSTGTLTASIQMLCAQAALFFLPMPAIKHPSISLTVADIFIIPAVILNLGFAMRLHFFQVLFLLALPFNLLSHMLDPAGDIIPLMQMVYIWGFLVPFGWCAFVTVPKDRIAFLLLTASTLSSIMAIGQFAGVLPALETQKLIELGSAGGRRAAGLVLQCNSLAMALTPCFLLLPSIRRASLRITFLLILIGGIASTVSKAIVFAVPGFLFYFFWCEPEKKKVIGWLTLISTAGVFVLASGTGINEFFDKLWNTIEYRLTYVDDSVGDRTHLAKLALGYASDCWLFGFGTNGTYERMGQDNMSQTVHVFYLGLLLTTGSVCFLLILSGMASLVFSLWRLRQHNEAIFLFAHLLAIGVTTMLYISYQYGPLIVACSALVRATFEHERQLQLVRQFDKPAPRKIASMRRVA